MWDALTRLNFLRNSFAHNLEPKNVSEKITGLVDFIASKKISGFDELASKYDGLVASIIVMHATLSSALRFRSLLVSELAIDARYNEKRADLVVPIFDPAANKAPD